MKRLAILTAAVSWLAFLVALLLPAVESARVDLLGSRDVWQLGIPGWQSALLAANSVDDLRSNPVPTMLAILASLTNLCMLATPWAVFCPQRGSAGLVRVATIGSILVNSAVLATWWQQVSFGSGYYVWVASFVMVAVALDLSRRAAARWVNGVSNPRIA